MIGSAAFFAPEMRTSPASGAPPGIRSLSTLARCSSGVSVCIDSACISSRMRSPERGIDELVALHAALAGERRAHDQRLEVLAVADDLDALAGQGPRAMLLSMLSGVTMAVRSAVL